MLVSPGAILIGIFGLLPVLMSLKLSFQKSDLLTPDTPWVGTQNYRELARRPALLRGDPAHDRLHRPLRPRHDAWSGSWSPRR